LSLFTHNDSKLVTLVSNDADRIGTYVFIVLVITVLLIKLWKMLA